MRPICAASEPLHESGASSVSAATAFSLLLFTESTQPSGFFLSRVPNERTLLVGVEVKAALDAISMSTSESKTL
jgi:hypothetical protein